MLIKGAKGLDGFKIFLRDPSDSLDLLRAVKNIVGCEIVWNS